MKQYMYSGKYSNAPIIGMTHLLALGGEVEKGGDLLYFLLPRPHLSPGEGEWEE